MEPHLRAVALGAGLWAAVGPACADDVVETARKAGQFTMLLKAVQQAGLESKMKTPGPFTVFAPTDAAFAALPPAVAKRLMDPANKGELAKVLSYHVLAGRLITRDLGTMPRAADTLIGAAVVLNPTASGVKVNEATITTPDMRVDNGVVHVIDKVLLPPMPIQPTF